MEISTRDRIIEHSAHQFISNGIRNITMDELAEQLGMSKRTIYEHFLDKKELVMECLKYFEKRKIASQQEILRTSENSFEALLNLFNANRDEMLRVNHHFFDDIKKYFPEVSQYRETVKEEIRELLLTALDHAKEEGFIIENLKSSVLSQLFTDELFSILNFQKFPKEKPQFMEFYETMYITFFRGIATEKGRAIIDKNIEKNKLEEK